MAWDDEMYEEAEIRARIPVPPPEFKGEWKDGYWRLLEQRNTARFLAVVGWLAALAGLLGHIFFR